jgi:hypothetical protein
LLLQVNHAEPVPNQMLQCGDQVEIASISGIQRYPSALAYLDQSRESMDLTRDGERRSLLVRRAWRPPRPSTDSVRTHDSICSDEVEAKRAELIKAFQLQNKDVDGDAVVAPRTPEQHFTSALIYNYGFVEGQPELN